MELRHIRYFAVVAQEENVSRAAMKLHVSQPALSRQIRDLEDELGFSLLHRSAKSVRLTPAGRVFLEESRAILGRVEEAVAAARAVATGGTDLHIGYAMSPTVRILPQALRSFQSARPGTRVRLHDLTTGEMIEGLRAGKLDLTFMVRPKPALVRGLHFEELARIPVCLAVAPGHPLGRRKSVRMADIAAFPLIAFNRSDYPDYHEVLDGWFSRAGVRMKIAEEHDSVSSLIAALEAGDGAALVTESIACISSQRLSLIRIVPAPSPLIIAAAWSGEALSPAAAQFLACAKRHAGESPRQRIPRV